jgi:hypothetical protein
VSTGASVQWAAVMMIVGATSVPVQRQRSVGYVPYASMNRRIATLENVLLTSRSPP